MRLGRLPTLIEKIGRTGLGVWHSACSLSWLWGALATLASARPQRLVACWFLQSCRGGIDGHTITLPSFPIALLISSSLTSSPSSISLWALPEGIMGKQLARAA